MNIFEQATRYAFRFESARGELMTEQMWDLPLQSKNGFDLDNIAKAINAKLKAAEEESFVSTKRNDVTAQLEVKLEIVKHIIAVRLAESAARQNAAARSAERARLVEALAHKQEEQLKTLSVEEIQARMAALDAT